MPFKLNYFFLFLFIFIFIITSIVLANPGFNRPLAKIIIVGNDLTKREVIERELLFTRGTILNDSLVAESKNRLENLWLFNRVEFFPLDNGDSVSLLISITERLYLFPYPEYKVEDRDWNKLTYGLGLAHDNFRGRNEKLFLSVLFGHRPGYKLLYRNPWIGHDLHLTSSFFLHKFTTPNRLEDFDERHFYTALSVGKYWTRNLSSTIYFTRDDIQVKSAFTKFLESRTRQDINYGFFLINTYDTRDLYAYPRKGTYIQLLYQKSGWFSENIDYAKYHLDLRKYFSWNDFIIASRFFTKQSSGNLPVYDKIFFGFSERIRGHFNESKYGNHLLSTGLAIRFPLMKLRYFSMPTVLLPESSTRNMKFGINAGIFGESGIVWSKKDEFKKENFISGFGFGVHFLLPYIEVLRIDMAFNEKLKHEFIIEIEMPF